MTQTTIYYGTREAMCAEIGTDAVYNGKYLVQLVGDAAYDAEGADSIKDMKSLLKQYKASFPNAAVVSLD